ncbi:MAG: DNA-directed DNA polymerase epsilon, subunit B [Pycnora praestabilis]|nr:MAG: DNA-directed DNA polymerase epsilon, subunit B [Pycnora praestabilis]
MNHQNHVAPRTASIFRPPAPVVSPDTLPSSSPAFGTPVHSVKPRTIAVPPVKPSILPILLPPPTLRPLAFRTFTKKHNLTLTSSALQTLATFIGKHCGSAWREEGLAEKVLEEVAKWWKKGGGGVIVEGDGDDLRGILRNLEGFMSGGRITQARTLSRQESSSFGEAAEEDTNYASMEGRTGNLGKDDSQTSLCISGLEIEDDREDYQVKDPRRWLKIVGAFEQPRLEYNVGKKHFEKWVASIEHLPLQSNTKPSFLPPPSHKTDLFRQRYNLIHQRLLRNESFQTPSFAPSRTTRERSSTTLSTTQQQVYKLTPIANLLGRSGSNHLILGLLTIAPTGTLAISDLTGSIALDVQHAKPVPEDGAWFAPGMIVLVDGIYEEDYNAAGRGLGGGGGIGGTIGGKFIGYSVGGPPCERREVTLGIIGANGDGNISAGGGFGWVDFLGVGSELALGSRMRKMERHVLGQLHPNEISNGRGRMVILGEVNLDSPQTLQALKKVFGIYAMEAAEDTPMTVVLMGNFVQHAVMAGGGSGGSIEYKEYFDSLASTLSDFPSLLQAATFVFVPGDNDPWASAFSAGAAATLPRKPVPELFTSRIKRAFNTANTEADRSNGKKTDGEAIWTSNPARLCLFGPTQEVIFFRDDVSGRLRRNGIRFRPSEDEDVVGHDEPALSITTTAAAEGGSEEIEHMEVDSTVQAAESHVPTSKSGDSADDTLSKDLLTSRKLVKTILDQGYLSPFPLTTRPILWDFATALQLYPLPTALVLVDTEAPPFTVTYEGCHVMNPGKLVAQGRTGVARWVEYDAKLRKGSLREAHF